MSEFPLDGPDAGSAPAWTESELAAVVEFAISGVGRSDLAAARGIVFAIIGGAAAQIALAIAIRELWRILVT